MTRNVKLCDASEEALIAELEIRRIDRKRAELQKILKGRSPEFFVYSQRSNRWHKIFDLDLVFTDGSYEHFSFDTANGHNEEDREKFLRTFFPPRLKEVSPEEFFGNRKNHKAKRI